jgi:ubiquinone biosynthesis protein Coq4
MNALFQRILEALRSFVDSLRGWRAGLALLADPSRLSMVFELDRALSRHSVAGRIATLRSGERGREAFEQRRRLTVDLAALGALPCGTLGRAFSDFLRKNGLDPGSIPSLPSGSDDEYFRAHLYDTHDLWHVVTGFDVDIAGELGVQAVYAAQFDSELPKLLLAGGLLQSALRVPDDFTRRVEAVLVGWKIGRGATSLFGVDWARLWSVPLDDVRRELGVGAA